MNFNTIKSNRRNLKRVSEILHVLAKHGFGYFVDHIQIKTKLPFAKTRALAVYENQDDLSASIPRRIRLVLEELGSTAIQLGQVLATREDLVGEEFAKEFETLHDNAVPLPFAVVRAVVEKEFGRPIDAVFADFSETPLASASLGQVHRATLENGEKVVVKVQRPGIEEQIKGDLGIMRYLVELYEKYAQDQQSVNLKKIALEYERTIHNELDYIQEKLNIKRFSELFEKDPGVFVPIVYEQFSTKKVITMTYIEGVKVKDLPRSSMSYDTRLLVRRVTDCFLKQILVYGYFHADPHPGNIFVLKNNVIAYIDFGMMGHADKHFVDDLVQAISFLLNYDVNGLVSHFTNMGLINDTVDLEAFKFDAMDLLNRYNGASVDEIDFGEVINKYTQLLTKHKLGVPREMIMIARSLMLMESIAAMLDPTFNPQVMFKPYVDNIVQRRRSINKFMDIFDKNAFELEHFIKVFPRSIKGILRNMEEGKIKIEYAPGILSRLTSRITNVGNKISIALILSSLVIGSAIIMQNKSGLLFLGYPIFGIIGYLVSGVIGLVMVFSMLNQNIRR